MTPGGEYYIFSLMKEVKFLSQPELKGTVAVLGFAGWANAGEVGTSTLTFLKEAVSSGLLAEIEADSFYDFTAHRPCGCVSAGRVTSLIRPSNTFYFASETKGPPTIFFLGEEPHLSWDRYCGLILEVLLRFDTRLVITVGGTYDERLHTDPPLVSYLAEDMVLAESVQAQGGQPGEYEGPISIHTYLYLACRQRGLAVVGLWGHAPAYVQTGNFHLVKKSLEMIAALGGPGPDISSLDEACQEMDQQLEALIERSPKLADYVQKLAQTRQSKPPRDVCLPKGKAKVIPLSRTRKEDDHSS